MLVQLVVIQITTFIFLVFIMRLLFHKRLDSAVKRLKELHQENLAREVQLKEEIEKAKKERLVQIEEGKKEAEEILEAAKKDIQRMRLDGETQARQRAEGIVHKGRENAEKIRRDLLSEIERRALDLSIQIMKYALSLRGKEFLQHQFIEEVIREIDGLPKDRFPAKAENIKIKTSCPLDDKERDDITSLLSRKIGVPVTLEEEIDEDLITGLIIQMDSLVIDGSLQNRLKKVIFYLKKEDGK